jgi:glycosyltransferase involved in cell wall biosynthesis
MTVSTSETSIGGKREVATRAARGDIVAHWDDDDWYGPGRLSRQALPILQGLADITGLNDMPFMVLETGEFWSVSRELFRRLFVENISGGTLMFRRKLWVGHGPYPPISLREDVALMTRLIGAGARLCRLPSCDEYVYVRHRHNTWAFQEGRYLQPQDWTLAPEPACLAADRSFYFGDAPARPTIGAALDGPLVSCIMPTANRRPFVARAIRQFLAQDYPRRELIVLDDGEDCVADLIPPDPAIRYLRLDRRASIGEKRNQACELARGPLIAHWDDDDWMAPGWLASQVETLLREDADICGLDKVFFYAPETREGWRYVYDSAQPWVCGGTLCYQKAYWRQVRFRDTNIGEDNALVWTPHPKRIAINDHDELFIATIHPHNTSLKLTSGARWRRVPDGQLESFMQRAGG